MGPTMRRISQAFFLVLFVSFAVFSVGRAEVIWSDEFDGETIDTSIWTYDVGGGGWGNGQLEYDTARWDNAYIENGNLVIEARRESYKGSNSFTSARLKTQGRFAFQYGTLEARIKVPNLANGLWPAFWLLGSNIGQVGWPACGEVDILEMGMKSAIEAGVVNRRIHAGAFWDYQGNNADYGLDYTSPVDLNNDYHIYKLVWTPTLMTVYLDSTPVWSFDISPVETASLEEFHRPMYLIVNLAVGGWNFVGITDPAQITAPLPAKMYIDWIRLTRNEHTVCYFGHDTAEQGTFGIYTETTPVDNHLHYDTDAVIYLWNNLRPVSTTPYEGTEAMSFDAAAGSWFGMGVFCLSDRNMTNYSDGTLHVYLKTASTAPFRIGIASSAAGEGWVTLQEGGEQFGLVRDGAWHHVQIPLNRFANVDFATIKQIFMLAGDAPSSALNLSLDNIYWTPNRKRPTPANGSFGVFTETASHKDAGEFALGIDGEFYVWENTLEPKTSSPYEGTASIALGSRAGLNWFGAAFTPAVKYNLTAFRYPESRLHFAMKTSSSVPFQIGMKSGNVEDIGQKWISFTAGSDPYGFVRDGQWHVVEIPMSDIRKEVDLSQVSQLFEILGTSGPISAVELDDICFLGGGEPLGSGSAAGDINGDGAINIDDLMMLAYYWLAADCGSENDFCFGADIQPDGTVNLHDLAEIGRHWLE